MSDSVTRVATAIAGAGALLIVPLFAVPRILDREPPPERPGEHATCPVDPPGSPPPFVDEPPPPLAPEQQAQRDATAAQAVPEDGGQPVFSIGGSGSGSPPATGTVPGTAPQAPATDPGAGAGSGAGTGTGSGTGAGRGTGAGTSGQGSTGTQGGTGTGSGTQGTTPGPGSGATESPPGPTVTGPPELPTTSIVPPPEAAEEIIEEELDEENETPWWLWLLPLLVGAAAAAMLLAGRKREATGDGGEDGGGAAAAAAARRRRRSQPVTDAEARLRAAFGAGLHGLDRAGLVEYDPAMPSGQVTRRLARVREPEPFVAASATFDEVVYGRRPATDADVSDVEQGFAAILGGDTERSG